MSQFQAGSETTVTYLNFLIVFMINFPSVQDKVQEELDRVVGRSRLPSLADGKRLPYTEAVIQEIHRMASITPFAIYHAPSEETTIAGYTFTKSDFIVPNLYEIHHDPRHFDDQGMFNPSRFIDEASGEFVPHPAVLPFGFGKRECLGKSLAKAEG